jgi:hypothetical protein
MAEINKDRNYLNSFGEYCPYCLSKNITKNGTPSIGGGSIKIPKRCLTCDYEWRDHYALIGYEETKV